MSGTDVINEMRSASAFNKQSAVFDELYSGNTIVQFKRQRVREHVRQFLSPGSRILELNAGTGEDAIYFAEQGHSIHATDISAGMQSRLAEKIKQHQLENKVTHEICSFTDLANLNQQGPYDLIFSNFAGLNCTGELDKVLRSFKPLLKDNGIVTLVLLPKFCLWETALALEGKFKTAFRRFLSGNGRKARVEGEYFLCWYYNPSYIKQILKPGFEVLSVEGLCIFVPPSYIENFAENHPETFKRLVTLENKWKTKWPWKSIGDYYIISFRKKDSQSNIAH
jgi:ubiquinone/menaquinone biosynthesis C-methylase UbiE